jgi:hypothetical protein
MNIVFVHFGVEVPAHLARNLERTIKLFPAHSIALITLPKTRIPFIDNLNRIDYLPDEFYWEISSRLSHPKDFRLNFWANTLTRFLALNSYMQQVQEEFIHVESDVILAQDFPFNKFSAFQKSIAFPVVNSEQGIASVLYLKDVSAAAELIRVIKSELESNSYTTDMLILRALYDKATHAVQVLPTGPSSSKCFNGDMNDETLIRIRESLKQVGGIIDGLDIGYYLFGEDPRNHRGKRIMRSLLSAYYLNPRSLQYSYSTNREFIDVVTPDGPIPIYALHIHSKNLGLFDLSFSRKIMKRAVLESNNPPSFDFLPRIFFKSVMTSVTRKIKVFFRVTYE